MKWRKRTHTAKPYPGRTAVYQFRDVQTQDHLYVGITNNIERRFRQHAGLDGEPKKWWWDQADHRHVTVTWYDTRRAALAVETRLIKSLRPPGNKLGNPDWEASTTWRPKEHRKEFVLRGAGKPILLGIFCWTMPLGYITGASSIPAVGALAGALAGAVCVRVAYRRLVA